MDQTLITNGQFLLQKFNGKGGWTYAEIPAVPNDIRRPFGWVRVRGNIDGYELKSYKLMPMGNGRLFLPVKAEIRKKIGKKEGDTVKVVLYLDALPLDVPQEIIECFGMEDPKAYEVFSSLTEGNQKGYLNWIYDAKTDDTKAERIAKMMDRLMKGLGMYDV